MEEMNVEHLMKQLFAVMSSSGAPVEECKYFMLIGTPFEGLIKTVAQTSQLHVIGTGEWGTMGIVETSFTDEGGPEEYEDGIGFDI